MRPWRKQENEILKMDTEEVAGWFQDGSELAILGGYLWT